VLTKRLPCRRVRRETPDDRETYNRGGQLSYAGHAVTDAAAGDLSGDILE
jgi:hypothetical protein